MLYGEGMYIGYRHYDRAGVPPLFPFGHGLSYTIFEYGRPSLSRRVLGAADEDVVHLVFAVSNLGGAAGAETAQVYVRDERSRLPRPEKELVAFEKIFLKPGETRHLTIPLDRYAVGYYDDSIPAWIAEEGSFKVLVGASAEDIRLVLIFFATVLLLLVVFVTRLKLHLVPIARPHLNAPNVTSPPSFPPP